MPFSNFLQNGGEMGALIRTVDWSKTALGSPESWPPSLKTMVGVALENKIGMYIAWGPEYIQIYNDAFRPILGKNKHPAAMGITSKITFSEIWDTIGPMFGSVMQGESIGFPDFMVPLDRNGYVEECYFDFSYSPIRLEDGKVGGVLVTVIETTENTLFLKQLKEKEERLQFVIESAELGTWDLDLVNKKFDANQRLRSWYGLPAKGEIPYPVEHPVVEEDRDRVINEISKSFNSAYGGYYDIEYSIIDPSDQKKKRLRAKGKTLFNSDKQPVRSNGVIEDITEQVAARNELLESQKHVERLFKQAPFPITLYSGKDLKIVLINDKALEVARAPLEKVLGKPLYESTPEVKGQQMGELLEWVYKTGKPFRAYENKLTTVRDGVEETVYFNAIAQPIFDADNNVSGVLSMGIDVTDQYLSRKRLEESEANLLNLVMNAPVAMCVFKGKDYVVEVANDPMLKLWGVEREQVINVPIFEGLPEAKEQGLEKILEDVFINGTSFKATEHEVKLLRNGKIEKTYINFVYEPFKEDDGKVTGIIAVAIEVTEQVNTRHKIEEAEERARLAVEGAEIGTFDVNLLTDELISSPRFNQIYGEEAVADRPAFFQRYHPDDIPVRDKAMEEAYRTGNLSFQARIMVDEERVRWVKIDGKVFYNEENKPSRLLGTVLDITSSVDLQRQKDDFLAIASHELKTPLTSIKGYTQILNSLVKKGDQVTSLNILKKTERQINKMTKLIHNFLDISKLETSKLQLQKDKLDINELISETINYFNTPDNKERLRFKAGDLPEVFADRGKIGHVIDNYLSNALKYSPLDKPVTISSFKANDGIIVSVTDEGIGINDTSQERIFERFFRADNVIKDTASGFGIGLYLSAEIIKLHNGKVWFESEEGKGSTFYFSLPLN